MGNSQILKFYANALHTMKFLQRYFNIKKLIIFPFNGSETRTINIYTNIKHYNIHILSI